MAKKVFWKSALECLSKLVNLAKPWSGSEVTSEVRGVGSALRGRYMERVRYVPAAVGVGGRKRKFPA